MFLAKSNPRETIQEHTNNLLEQYRILKDLYGRKICIDWEILYLACLYHDLGKMNEKFQAKIRRERINGEEVPHGYLSTAFFDIDKLEEEYSEEDIAILISVVANHHYREFDLASKEELFYKEVENLKAIEDFEYDKLASLYLDDYSYEYIYPNGLRNIIREEDKYKYILLKGFLNKIDYAASGNYRIEYPSDFLIRDMENLKSAWGPDGDFNELQIYMRENQRENIIAVAETGYGKTEAGLLWIGDNKGFFILPLRAAINDIYRRINRDIVKENIEEKVALLHSSSLDQYLKIFTDNVEDYSYSEMQIMDYNDRGREMSLGLNICTIDQIFDFVYKYRNFESKLATLSYSKIVIDEIQMYGADLIAYLIKGLEMITKVGGSFSIITATLPPFILNLLEERNIKYKVAEKRYSQGRIRHSMEVIEGEINGEFILSKYKDNKVLVIVNTIRKAQELYLELESLGLGNNINIFHSQFIQRDRNKKEKEIINFGRTDFKGSRIWICTQVAEASLDIDFDILITELSEVNGLFQRMGRCYRKRELEESKVNVFLFNGGDKKTSGIGSIVDEDIFSYSKAALRKLYENKNIIRFTELDKWKLIDEIYSLEKIKDTGYYREIRETINYIDSIFFNEMNKKEVNKRFRNINSIEIIPESIYLNGQEEINKLIEIINEPYMDKSNKTREEIFEKTKARIKLDEYKVSIGYYYVNESNTRKIRVNRYENLNLYNCDYSPKFGIKHISSKSNELEGEIEGDFII